MSTINADLDPVLRYACKLMHSSHPESAEKLRNAIDDVIRQRYGAQHMLINTMPKRYLADESHAPGSGIPLVPVATPALHRLTDASSRRTSSKSLDSRASSLARDSPRHGGSGAASAMITTITLDSGGSNSGDGGGADGMDGGCMDEGDLVISVPDDDDDEDEYMMSEADHMKELEDLMCQVCRRMDVSARNRLIECADCHALYHQDCHKPTISDADANEQEFSWCCTICKNKLAAQSAAAAAAAAAAASAAAAAIAATLSRSGHSGSPTKSSSGSSTSGSQQQQQIGGSRTAHKPSTKSYQHSFEAALQPRSTASAGSVSAPSMPSLGNLPATGTSSATGSHRAEGSGHHHHKSKSSSSSSSSSSRHHKSSSSAASREREKQREKERVREERAAATAATVALAMAGSGSHKSSNINIISADKRLQNMKKKAALKLQETRRKH